MSGFISANYEEDVTFQMYIWILLHYFGPISKLDQIHNFLSYLELQFYIAFLHWYVNNQTVRF